MKKSLKKMLTPTRSFEDWAVEHSIPLERKQPKKIYFTARIACACLSVLILVLAIVPLSLKSNNTIDNNTVDEPKYYSSQDVVSQSISLNELYNVDNIIFFQPESVIQFQKITVDVLKDDNSLIFSYNVDSAIIATKDEQNAFVIDLTARVYPNYDFYGSKSFKNLSNIITVNNTKEIQVQYEIIKGVAFIAFNYNEIDYFMTVKEFEGITEINDNTITILLEELLS